MIVATGSKPRALPGVAIDNERVLDNEGALAIPDVPKRLGVVGAGVIGLEMGSVWRRLGLGGHDARSAAGVPGRGRRAVAKEALKASRKQASRSELGVKIAHVDGDDKDVSVDYADATGAGAKCDVRPADRVDRPRAAHRGSRRGQVGLALDERGFVNVDAECRTDSPNVWAIGDVVRGPMLAHKAEEEGVAVAERIAGSTGTSTSTRCRG